MSIFQSEPLSWRCRRARIPGVQRNFPAARIRVFVLAVLLCLLPDGLKALNFTTVVIDAGHGGQDPGCRWNGLTEKKLCLDVAKRLETQLKKRGDFRVVMTRRSDVYVELADRAAIANKYSRAIFVSVHFNACPSSRIEGMEVFYRSRDGKALARSILRSMDRRLKGANRGVNYNDLKVLRATTMPAVLVEAAYLSNKKEARRYADPDHRQELAEAIAAGIAASRS